MLPARSRSFWKSRSLCQTSNVSLLPPAARSLPPVAHASGSHSLTLPNSSLVLRGSVTDGDPGDVHFLWTRDSQSPAAGVCCIRLSHTVGVVGSLWGRGGVVVGS